MQIKKISYLRKIDTKTGKIKSIYTYQELLFDLAKRIRLHNELESDHSVQLYCACCKENTLPVMLSENMAFQFPVGKKHDPDCVQYLSALLAISSRQAMLAFTGQRVPIPVDFKWTKGCRKTVNTIRPVAVAAANYDRLSLSSFVAIMSILAYMKTKINDLNDDAPMVSFTEKVAFELKKHTIIDPSGKEFSFPTNPYINRNSELGTMGFFYAKILKVNNKYNSKVYIYGEGITGKISLSVKRTDWDKVAGHIAEGLPLWMAGFANVKTVKIFSKGSYDSTTHTAYGQDIQEKKEIFVTSFTLFNTNQYGLLCFTEKEKELGERASRAGIPLLKPFYPVPGFTDMPLLIICNANGEDYYYGGFKDE